MCVQEKAAATEAYRAKLLEGMNAPLVMDFREAINEMRERALGDERHYSESDRALGSQLLLLQTSLFPTYTRPRFAAQLADFWR